MRRLFAAKRPLVLYMYNIIMKLRTSIRLMFLKLYYLKVGTAVSTHDKIKVCRYLNAL